MQSTDPTKPPALANHPFDDFDELLPRLGAGAARLPRRQSGSAPQNLAVTMLADYGLRDRAWLPSAAIVALLADFGVSPGGARTAISRLARRGVLDSHREGRRTAYRLTRTAATALAIGGRRLTAFCADAEAWDECWTVIAFSLPQERDAERRGLRGHLRWLDFAPLYDGLWVSPHAMPDGAAAALAEAVNGAITVFRARQVDLNIATRNPLDAWDLTGAARLHTDFVQRWSTAEPGLRSGTLDGADALRIRTQVMDDYRHLPFADPPLPMRLMPTGWLRTEARRLFEALYDGLSRPALEHVRQVVAGVADAPAADPPPPNLRVHTVGELMAGLQVSQDPDSTSIRAGLQ